MVKNYYQIKIITPKNTDLIDKFFLLSELVYQEDKIWMGENRSQIQHIFNSDRHYPFIVLDENDQPVARCVAIYNPNAKTIKGLEGWVGYFECMKKDIQAGIDVLHECYDFFREKKVYSVVGPKLDNLQLGLLLKGFDKPQSVLSTHNPKYYQKIFKKAGFKIKFKTLAFYFTREFIQRFEIDINPEIITRELDIDNIDNEIKIFHKLNMEIFAGTNDYVPRTLDEERELVNSLLPFIDPKLVIIAEDKEHNPIGLIICLPDAYQLRKEGKINRLRVISVGVVPSWRRKKVAAHLGNHLMRNGMPMKQYQYAEASFILERNIPSQLLAKKFKAKVGRTFGLFERVVKK